MNIVKIVPDENVSDDQFIIVMSNGGKHYAFESGDEESGNMEIVCNVSPSIEFDELMDAANILESFAHLVLILEKEYT